MLISGLAHSENVADFESGVLDSTWRVETPEMLEIIAEEF
jgi:hypothetical protein